ncbi:unnamed protein product [Eretmochelys imbricata]
MRARLCGFSQTQPAGKNKTPGKEKPWDAIGNSHPKQRNPFGKQETSPGPLNPPQGMGGTVSAGESSGGQLSAASLCLAQRGCLCPWAGWCCRGGKSQGRFALVMGGAPWSHAGAVWCPEAGAMSQRYQQGPSVAEGRVPPARAQCMSVGTGAQIPQRWA